MVSRLFDTCVHVTDFEAHANWKHTHILNSLLSWPKSLRSLRPHRQHPSLSSHLLRKLNRRPLRKAAKVTWTRCSVIPPTQVTSSVLWEASLRPLPLRLLRTPRPQWLPRRLCLCPRREYTPNVQYLFVSKPVFMSIRMFM